MTAVTLDTLTDDDHTEIERHLTAYAGYGWKPVDSAHSRTRTFTPGLRVRHVGQQYPKAYWHGTGVIAAVLTNRREQVELVVVYDEPRIPGCSRVTVLADYHVDLGPFEAVA